MSNSIRLDGHVDFPIDDENAHFSIELARRGGINASVITIQAQPTRRGGDKTPILAELERQYANVTDYVGTHSDSVRFVHTPQELIEAQKDGKFAVILGYQNVSAFDDVPNLDALNLWVDRGVRQFAFAFIGTNWWAESARAYPFVSEHIDFQGLSPLAIEGVRRLNERGVIVDVSQLSTRGVDVTLDVSSAPVLASHTGFRSVVDVPRNLTDANARRIADNGGLVNVVAFALYLRAIPAQRKDEVSALWREYGLTPPQNEAEFSTVDNPETAGWDDAKFWEFLHKWHVVLDLDHPTETVQNYIDSIDKAVELVGIDHVGLASDFNHGGGVADWINASQAHNVSEALLGRGYTQDDINKLWGENYIALWQAVTDAAADE
ncbi:MAG: dipeptidase [Propionibacteriaceae bacterium]|jgi:microsomal dipeptidase-like Zn-dependent dipeptidase|nr:dipeptidase [Propionibacteriaceae bacterium]